MQLVAGMTRHLPTCGSRTVRRNLGSPAGGGAPRDGARAQSDNSSERTAALTCVGSLGSRPWAPGSRPRSADRHGHDERHRPHALSGGGRRGAEGRSHIIAVQRHGRGRRHPSVARPRLRRRRRPWRPDTRLRQLSAEWATDDISEVLPNRLYIGTPPPRCSRCCAACGSAASSTTPRIRTSRAPTGWPTSSFPSMTSRTSTSAATLTRRRSGSRASSSGAHPRLLRPRPRARRQSLAALMKLKADLLDAWLRLKRPARAWPNPGSRAARRFPSLRVVRCGRQQLRREQARFHPRDRRRPYAVCVACVLCGAVR